MIKSILFLTFLLSICGCRNSDSNVSSVDIDWLYSADPLDDFKKAVEIKDYRFIGIYRYSLIVLGVRLKCIDAEQDVKPIEGTSDSYSSYEEEKFNAVARVYADHYNFQLRKYLEGKNLFSCDEGI